MGTEEEEEVMVTTSIILITEEITIMKNIIHIIRETIMIMKEIIEIIYRQDQGVAIGALLKEIELKNQLIENLPLKTQEIKVQRKPTEKKSQIVEIVPQV